MDAKMEKKLKRINYLQDQWNIYNRRTRELWEHFKNATKNVISEMKGEMERKTKARSLSTISKISPLLTTNVRIVHMVFIGEAPGTSMLPFIGNPNNIIHAQTYIGDIDQKKLSVKRKTKNRNLNSDQIFQWKEKLENDNVKDLNIYIKLDGNAIFLDGDLMDKKMTALSLGVALSEVKTAHARVLSCDAGMDPEMMEVLGFDSWEVLSNIMDSPDVHMFDIIVCKIQNALRFNKRHPDVNISSFILKCKKFADSNKFKMGFSKLIGSWDGNDEIYFCFFRPEILFYDNPLIKCGDPIDDFIALLTRMTEYKKEVVDNIELRIKNNE